jgi:hypothetical protein
MADLIPLLLFDMEEVSPVLSPTPLLDIGEG